MHKYFLNVKIFWFMVLSKLLKLTQLMLSILVHTSLHFYYRTTIQNAAMMALWFWLEVVMRAMQMSFPSKPEKIWRLEWCLEISAHCQHFQSLLIVTNGIVSANSSVSWPLYVRMLHTVHANFPLPTQARI